MYAGVLARYEQEIAMAGYTKLTHQDHHDIVVWYTAGGEPAAAPSDHPETVDWGRAEAGPDSAALTAWLGDTPAPREAADVDMAALDAELMDFAICGLERVEVMLTPPALAAVLPKPTPLLLPPPSSYWGKLKEMLLLPPPPPPKAGHPSRRLPLAARRRPPPRWAARASRSGPRPPPSPRRLPQRWGTSSGRSSPTTRRCCRARRRRRRT
jgi:hypothetical protein